jgi:hypothetical protein
MSTDTPFQPSASAANPTAAPFDRIAQLERELAEAKAERDDAHTKLGSVLFKLPHDILCGDVRKWYEEHKAERDTLERELADLKNAGGLPLIRSEAIRNLRDEVCGLKAERDQLRAELERLRNIVTQLGYDEGDIDRPSAQSEIAQLRARVESLEQDKARMAEQIQRDNDACQKLSGFTFEELSWEFERLKNNLLNAEQQIEDANRIIGLFFEACSETNVGLFHERLGAAFETCKTYRAAIDAARGKGTNHMTRTNEEIAREAAADAIKRTFTKIGNRAFARDKNHEEITALILATAERDREIATLKAQLRERTQFICRCGGTKL